MDIQFIVLALIVAVSAILFVLRHAEESRGQRFFADARSKLDQQTMNIYEGAVMGGVPHVWRDASVKFIHDVTHGAVQQAVKGLRSVERPLSRLSYKMRVSQPKATAGEVSEFLKTITPERPQSELVEKSV